MSQAGAHGDEIRARFDSGFYSKDLFAMLEDKGVTYLCGALPTARLTSVIRGDPRSLLSPVHRQRRGQGGRVRLPHRTGMFNELHISEHSERNVEARTRSLETKY